MYFTRHYNLDIQNVKEKKMSQFSTTLSSLTARKVDCPKNLRIVTNSYIIREPASVL